MGKFNELHIIRNTMMEKFGTETSEWSQEAINQLESLIKDVLNDSTPIIIKNVIEYVFKWPEISELYIEEKRRQLND